MIEIIPYKTTEETWAFVTSGIQTLTIKLNEVIFAINQMAYLEQTNPLVSDPMFVKLIEQIRELQKFKEKINETL